MPLKEAMNKIREEKYSLTIKQGIIQVALMFALGMLLGYLAKYSDTIPSNGLQGSLWGIISEITTRLGIWILLATIIAAWSNNPRIGAVKVFSFFSGMLLVYYIYSMMLFNFFPAYYFIRWGGIALASPIAAYLVWYGKGNGWLAAFFAALPIGLLISIGYPFFYMYSITYGFELLSALILFLILPANKKQYGRVFVLTILIVIILRNSNTLSYLFGGL